ncbi:MAG: hypothetical protein IJW75_02195 [Alphaproteobacteria bacterium]|nr:hypothetical protein [Alphaproteobacteria bacterium]
MEVFLFIALIFIYILTAFTVPAKIVKRVWILAYTAAFVITALSIMFISTSKQTVLMQESEMNWYYFLYLFGSMSVILGLINIWIYRKELIQIFSTDDAFED